MKQMLIVKQKQGIATTRNTSRLLKFEKAGLKLSKGHSRGVSVHFESHAVSIQAELKWLFASR